MSGINYDQRNQSVSLSSKIVRYGKYREVEDENGFIKPEVVTSIDIATFYRLYLELNNVIGSKQSENKIVSTVLSPVPLDLLVHLMMKDEYYTIVFRNKDATLVKLGAEIGKTSSSVYSNLSKLRETGYVVKDEDNLLVLSKELSDLRKLVKFKTQNGEPLTFDFLFKFCVTNKDEA